MDSTGEFSESQYHTIDLKDIQSSNNSPYTPSFSIPSFATEPTLATTKEESCCVATAEIFLGNFDNQVEGYLSITFDNYPLETGWRIEDNESGEIVRSVPFGTYCTECAGRTIEEYFLLEKEKSYTVVFEDFQKDGMCCSH